MAPPADVTATTDATTTSSSRLVMMLDMVDLIVRRVESAHQEKNALHMNIVVVSLKNCGRAGKEDPTFLLLCPLLLTFASSEEGHSIQTPRILAWLILIVWYVVLGYFYINIIHESPSNFKSP